MREYLKFYIGGEWVDPVEPRRLDVFNPATEQVAGQISLGSAADVDKAVAAAREAFASWSQSSREERLELLERILAEYERRQDDIGAAIQEELGAPTTLAKGFQVFLGAGHLKTAIEVLKHFRFEEPRGATLIVREPIGVCGLITPWNWPINQIAVKVFPALATGCTVILKPSEVAPFSACLFAEVLDAAGVPPGVFNLINGDGAGVGTALSRHPGIDKISFTGSNRAGIQITRDAADTVKRVTLELGGKSPFILLDDADLAKNVAGAVAAMMGNSGQTCSAGSRLLVPASRLEEVIAAARSAAEGVTVGDPAADFAMGPLVSERQFNLIQDYIRKGLDEGAQLVAGGLDRPDGLDRGWYVKPTVFLTSNDTTIAREEIFGPVLVIIAYDDIDHAVELANDTDFGLAGYVSGEDPEQCRAVARRLRAGWIGINGGFDFNAAFGGYKHSGNGREWGEFGFDEYLEIKSLLGYAPAPAG